MSIDESEFTEMKDKLMEQETMIEDLQTEMENLRIISVQHKEQTQKVYIYCSLHKGLIVCFLV